ncbi:type IV pilus biogenesis protein PilM [Malonomonas rubra]|uniref:type IV pilus biogenesis protein PilM n=1 Tax=Malonomonas rubra TaxID=57040 RepID=UPI0026ECAC90|nr:hypothetical protein [Malonomonas rubra]
MKRRTFLGLDLASHSFRAVALRRHGRDTELAGARLLNPAPEVIRFSSREPNLVDRFRFVSQVREILAPLADREERIVLSLPDCTGRTLLTEVETVFKTHQEGEEILKWQLKNSLPGEPASTHIDFQFVGQTDAGKQRVLVAAIRSDILTEYEDALEEAGYGAVLIDFHAMNLYNYYRPRFTLDESFVLVSVDGESLSIHYNVQGHPVYFRARSVVQEAESVFQELSRTLVAVCRTTPQLRKAAVFMHSDWEHEDALRQALEGCFEKEVQTLDLQKHATITMSHAQPQVLAAAIGAAERLM